MTDDPKFTDPDFDRPLSPYLEALAAAAAGGDPALSEQLTEDMRRARSAASPSPVGATVPDDMGQDDGQSINLTPGFVWSESQLRVVRDLSVRVVRAEAAVAARPSADTETRALAEWLVLLDDDDPESPGRQDRRTVTLTAIIDRARAALDGER